MNKKTCMKTAHVLVLIGAINLGLVGLGDFLGNDLNVVNTVLGSWPTVESVFYVLVGLSGLKIAYHEYVA